MIMIDYQTSNLDRQVTIFLINRLANFWLQHFQNIELQNSLLSNINDDGDNNEKTKKLKTRMGIFKNMGGNIPGGNFPGENFPGASFPDTGCLYNTLVRFIIFIFLIIITFFCLVTENFMFTEVNI